MNEILLLEIDSNQKKLCFNNSQSVVNYNNNAFLPTPFEISKMVLSGNLTESFAEIRMIFSEAIASPNVIADVLMWQKVVLRKIVDGIDTIIISGIISAFTSITTEFSFVITDEIYKFKEPVLSQYTTKCKASFCSEKCGMKTENYSTNGEIAQVKRNSIVLKNTQQLAFYINGIATIFSKTFVRTMQIRDVINNEIFFFEDIPFFVKNGDSITLLQGCDKTFAMCGKFGNEANFRGEIVI